MCKSRERKKVENAGFASFVSSPKVVPRLVSSKFVAEWLGSVGHLVSPGVS